jgi:hypothetical protein
MTLPPAQDTTTSSVPAGQFPVRMGGSSSSRRLYPFFVLLALLLALVFLVAPAEAAIPCTIVNETLPVTSETVDASCTNITFVNASASGQTIVTINLTAALLANPAAPTILVRIINMSLFDGAVLVINAGKDETAAAPGPNVSVAVLGLRGTDGALAIGGSFPPGSSILVRDAAMTSGNATTAPTVSFLAPGSPTTSKIFVLFDLALTNGSAMAITDSSLSVVSSFDCHAFYVAVGLSISYSSNFTLAGLEMTSALSIAFAIDSSPVTVQNNIDSSPVTVRTNSLWNIIGTTMTSRGGIAFYISSSSSVNVHNGSEWNVMQTNMVTSEDGYVFWIASSSSVTVQNNSEWNIMETNMTASGSGARDAFSLDFSSVTVRTDSLWNIIATSMTSGGRYAFRIYYSSVTVQTNSVWSIMQTTMTSSSSIAFAVDSSSVTVQNDSVWNVMQTNMTASGGGWAFAISSVASIIVRASGWVLWRSNELQTAGSSDPCIRSDNPWNISDGVMSFADNNCTGGSIMSGVSIAGNGRFYQRCNRHNGTVTASSGLPMEAVSAGACGSCNVSADCFRPLTCKPELM